MANISEKIKAPVQKMPGAEEKITEAHSSQVGEKTMED
jgi:hypothetical protein